MPTRFRWGVLSTGAIANKFAQGLAAVPDSKLVAVGSRDRQSADRFGDAFGVPHRHGSYRDLAADPEVDAIYVGTPHDRHCEDTLLCLEHGKAVLCEKPFAIHARQAERMIAAARERGLFLMEAMWTRFNPVMVRLRELLAAGAIGDVRMLHCDFGFRAEFDAEGRLFAKARGGGALLDVGVYCVSLAHMVFGGPPAEVAGLATLGSTGVDEQSAWVMRWPGGELAVLSSAVRTDTPQEAVLSGTDGILRIPEFWRPDRLIVDGNEQRFAIAGNGYGYEAAEVQRCVRAGLTESPVMTLDQTLAIQRDLDRIRAQWGLRYPAD